MFAAEFQVVIRTDIVTLLRRGIAAASFLLGAGLLGWAIQLDNAYPATMPHVPEPSTGRDIPMILHHGSHIFVNAAEADRWRTVQLYNTVGWPFVALGIGIAGADHLWSRKKRA